MNVNMQIECPPPIRFRKFVVFKRVHEFEKNSYIKITVCFLRDSATVLLKTNDNSNWGYIRFELWFPIKYAKANMNSMDYNQPLKGHILNFTEG